LTIRGVPKRSTSIPKASTQKVFCEGIVTLPPLAKASLFSLPERAPASSPRAAARREAARREAVRR
jgi:hypothetical protein